MSSSRSLATLKFAKNALMAVSEGFASDIKAVKPAVTSRSITSAADTARADGFLTEKTVQLAKKMLTSSSRPYETGLEPAPAQRPDAAARMKAFIARTDYSLAGKTIVITGGAGQLGSDVARLAQRRGMNTVLADHPKANFSIIEEDLAELGRHFGGKNLSVAGDLTKPEAREELVNLTVNTFGSSLHGVVFSAGLYMEGYLDGATKDIRDAKLSKFHAMVDVNVHAPLTLLTEFQPHMQPGTHAVAVTSLAGRQAVPGEGLYGLTKWAEGGLWKYLAKDFGMRHGIKCSQVSPSAIKGPMAKGRPGLAYSLLHESADVAKTIMNNLETRGNTLAVETNLDGVISPYENEHVSAK